MCGVFMFCVFCDACVWCTCVRCGMLCFVGCVFVVCGCVLWVCMECLYDCGFCVCVVCVGCV